MSSDRLVDCGGGGSPVGHSEGVSARDTVINQMKQTWVGGVDLICDLIVKIEQSHFTGLIFRRP